MTARTVNELSEAFRAMRSTGQTWVWELFAGEHIVTRLSTAGGHVAGQPLELNMGIDLSDEDTVNQVLAALDEFDPFLVTIGFPCDPWGPLSRLNIGRGHGHTVFAKRDAHWGFICLTAQILKRQLQRGRLAIAENPWTSAAWDQSPLAELLGEGYVKVRGDQCMFGLRNWMNKILHLKPTGFMVPAGSALEAELSRRCSGDHEHTPVMDGGGVTKAAGTWPPDLGKAILKASIQDAIGMAPMLVHYAVSRQGGEPTVNLATPEAVAAVARALYLRPEILELHGAAPGGELPAMGYQRRLIIGFNEARKLVHFEDLWDKDANRAVLRLASGFTPMAGDRLLVVSILLTNDRVQSAFPAKLLKRLRTKTPAAEAEVREVTDVDTDDDRDPEAPPRPVLPDGRLKHDGFGEKPAEVTARQYEAIKRLHHNLAHPANTSLMRMPRRWGAQPAVISCIKELKCHACAEIRMPQPSRRAGQKAATPFHYWVAFDETEAVLSDGSTLTVPIWEQVKTALELWWQMWGRSAREPARRSTSCSP